MTINYISETEFFPKDQGVHTAYLTTLTIARRLGYKILINSFQKSDIVHVQTIGFFSLFKLKTSKNTIVTAHLVPESFVGSLKGITYWFWFARLYLRYLYNSADLVLAVSPLVKKNLVNLGVETRIEVLPNPVDDTLFRKVKNLREIGRKKLNIPKEAFVLMCVGQVQPRKGVTDFMLLARKFKHLTFVWIGGKPFKSITAEDSKMNELLANPPNNFFLKGTFNYSEIPEIYNAADVFLFPSFQENAPMAVVEASSCRLPLVFRDNPEYKLLYGSGYIACTNIKDFEQAIRRLSTDKKYYDKYADESDNLASRFGLGCIGKELAEHYAVIAKK